MPTATVSDVKSVINTGLSDSEINESLKYAQELNQEYNDESAQSSVQTKNIERWGAVVNIRQYKERMVTQESTGGSSASYEGNDLQHARTQLRQWVDRAGGDPAMVDHMLGVVRDSNRHVAQTEES
jgi:hypothetical protein